MKNIRTILILFLINAFVFSSINFISAEEEVLEIEPIAISEEIIITGNTNEYNNKGGLFFYKDVQLLDIDNDTFEIIGDGFWAKDITNVYHGGKIAAQADPEIFEALNEVYGKDINSVFYRNFIMNNANVDTFQQINNSFAIDNNNVYYLNRIINKADPDTFTALNETFAKDKYRAYYQDRLMEVSHLDSFFAFNSLYSKDRNTTYYYIYPINGSDVNSFAVIDDNYSKDKNIVFYRYNKIIESDPGTFEVMSKTYAKDKSNYYKDGKALSGSEQTYFERFRKKDLSGRCGREEILGEGREEKDLTNGFLSSDNCVYFKRESILDSHLSTFAVINNEYAKDKNYIYYFSNEGITKLEYSDPVSFQILGKSYARDKYTMYYQAKEFEIGGYDSFKVICTHEKCDVDSINNNNLYLKGEIAEVDAQMREIIEGAIAVYNSSNDINKIVEHNNTKRNLEEETDGMLNLTNKIVDYSKLTMAGIYAINNFIVYGTVSTQFLGAGERAGVVNSYKSAYKKMPATEEEWIDVIKIGTGRWPSIVSEEAEFRAKGKFGLIYKRAPFMYDSNDNAAITIMAYGLRPTNRNMESEEAAIMSFRRIFYEHPNSAADWDIVRAISYSGATR